MSNVARHSGATSLNIRLAREDDQATMTLADDGVGFDPAGVTPAPEQGRGLGLAGMRERASLAAGQVSVTSAPGRGTTVRVVIPLPTAAEEPAEATAQVSMVDDHR
jgi:two-component system sensor histidine kinase UhpB